MTDTATVWVGGWVGSRAIWDNVSFLTILWCSKGGDRPNEHFDKFGHKLNMNAKKINRLSMSLPTSTLY
jgi:hypothetical protein